MHSDNDFAPVAFLRIKSAELKSKETLNRTVDVPVPPLLEEDFQVVRDIITLSQKSASVDKALKQVGQTQAAEPINNTVQTQKIGSWISVANIERKLQNPIADVSVEFEVTECFLALKGQIQPHCLLCSDSTKEFLNEYGLDTPHCAMINIFLSSMDLFPRVNTVYSSFFGSSPPARACVAVDLPHPIRIRLDCIAFVECSPTDRQALHVQGLSYWAPANIGPYSQAITVPQNLYALELGGSCYF
jgi:diphthine-ammonia ligase